MTIIIFAGGAGTRLWPLSRNNSPKQFTDLAGGKSTLQLAVERIQDMGLDHVFISTNEKYRSIVQRQIPDLPDDHILGEPARRDVAAAVGLSLMRLKKKGTRGTVAILWSDHFMKHPDRFVTALRQGEGLIQENPDRFVFLGETPRFANHNLGWIHLGAAIADGLYEFRGWKYRPELPLCEKLFGSGEWMWNPGYFIFDIDFVLGLYQQFMPTMYDALNRMTDDEQLVSELYPTLETISFDNAIVEKVEPSQAVVLKVDLGWSDPGTLYALKEAVVPGSDNMIKGNAFVHETSDSFVYNEEEGKLVTTIGLEGMVVVNTKDVLLVCHKDKVPEVKAVLKKLEEEGKEQYV